MNIKSMQSYVSTLCPCFESCLVIVYAHILSLVRTCHHAHVLSLVSVTMPMFLVLSIPMLESCLCRYAHVLSAVYVIMPTFESCLCTGSV